MRKLFLSLAFVAVATFAMANPFVWPGNWTVTAPGEAVAGGVYRDHSTSDPRTFNPIVSAEQNALVDITDLEGASLLMRGPDSDAWIPYAAESFTLSDDGTVMDLVLRDGIKWSDGTPVTVQDYFMRYLIETDPDAGSNAFSSWFLNDVPIVVEITGPASLRFTFPGPDRLAFPVAALLPIPDHVFGEAYRSGGAEAVKALWGTESDVRQVLTTGPFRPTLFAPGERVVFERNPYFGDWNVDEAGTPLPFLDGMVTTIVGSADSALNLYLAGDIDTFAPRNLDDIGVINVAMQNGDIDAVVLEAVAPVARSAFIVFNWNKASDPVMEATFRNVNFRRAMWHLVDREALIELVYGGNALPMHTQVYLPNTFWLNDDVTKYDFDPERALELLALAGWSRRDAQGFLVNDAGRRLSFTLATNAGNVQREQITQIFADDARSIGVDVTTTPLDFSLLVDQLLSTGDDRPWDAILIGLFRGSRDWPSGSNVDICSGNLHMFNTTGDCITPQETLVEELHKLGRATLDTDRARDIMFEIQAIQSDQAQILYTVSPMANYSWLSAVQGEHPIAYLNDEVGARQLALTWMSR